MPISGNRNRITGGNFGSPKFNMGGCKLYTPLWRPDMIARGGSIASGTGTMATTPLTLAVGANTITALTAGTFIVTIPYGGTVASGTATITGSPVTIPASVATSVTTGVTTGNFTVTPSNIIRSKDSTGHLCTITGTTWNYQGRVADGDDQIDLGTNAVLDIGDLNSYTLITWFKCTDVTGIGMAIAFGNSANNTPNVRLGYNTSALEANHRADGATAATLTGSSIVNNTWYHAAFVRRAAADFELYQDGVSIDTDTTGPDTTTLNTFYLMAWVRLLVVLPFSGTVGEAWMYNRALTLAELKQHCQATKWRYA